MGRNLLGMLLLLKCCFCNDVHNFDGDIRDFVVCNKTLYVLTDHRLHQMRHDLKIEKMKVYDGTRPNPVTLLVPFEANGTLITCGTSYGGYCEVLDLKDITNAIYSENKSSVPRQNETSVAFIVDASAKDSYILVGMKDNSIKPPFCVFKLWNTLHSQTGNIFSEAGDKANLCVHSTTEHVEFVDGFRIISRKDSYVLLNAKTKTGWQVYVLRLNYGKRKKNDIIKELKGNRLECCDDTARPVLLASALIPSDQTVLVTGVFSAQNMNDPENTALAVYDIGQVDGKLKDFCSSSENWPCTQTDKIIKPIAVVFKYKSMSSVTAVRDGSWIVLFIGTEDGQLIKLALDERFNPGCPTVLYRSDIGQEVFPRMHLDPVDSKYIYIALKNQIRRVSVVQCAKYSSLRDCRAAQDPFCGWCDSKRRCSPKDECSTSSWVSFTKDSLRKQLLSFQMAKNSFGKITLHLAMSLESTQNPAFSCAFIAGGVNLCDRSDPAAVFPNCSCSFSHHLLEVLSTEGSEILATVTIEDQKITETLMLKNCPRITDNSSYTQCVQCFTAGCQWSPSLERCDWTLESEAHILDVGVCKETRDYKEPEILSIQSKKVSFNGRNSVLLTGRYLKSITKIHIQTFPVCIVKESPVFDRSSDSLRFHIPPSGINGAAKVCAATADGRCHGNSIITYSSLPSCKGLQPKVTWKSGGRKIHLWGTNMEVVESIIVRQSNKELKTQYNKKTGDIWFYTHPYDGNTLMLKVGNSTLDCADLTTHPDPVFNGFTTTQIHNEILVIIKKNADKLNLSTDEVKVSGVQEDQEYECVLERIESNTIMCKINAVIQVDSLTIRVGRSFVLRMGQSSTKYLFCFKPQDPS